MNDKITEILNECAREEENCLYTSTTLYFWLKHLRRLQAFFITAPLLLGGFAGVKVLASNELDYIKYFLGISALLAGVLPSIYTNLKLDIKIKEVDYLAGKYKIMQGTLRRLRKIHFGDENLPELFCQAISELNRIKSNSITPPERFFKRARKKIKKGDYEFDSDAFNKNI